MDDSNRNVGKDFDNFEDQDISAYLDRREKVRNFKVNIEETNDAFSSDEYMSDAPVYKGEVYFSNHARKSTPPAGASAHTPGQAPRVQAGQPMRPASPPRPGAPRKPVTQGSRPSASSSASAAAKKKKKAKKRVSVLTSSIKVLIAIALCTALLSGIAITCINDVLAINKDSDPVTVEIPESATTDEIIDILGSDGLISRPLMCKMIYGMLTKIKKSPTPEYISGIFYLKPNMGLEGMLNKLKETQNYSETVTLSFPEGWSINQIFTKLDKYKVCDSAYLYKAAQSVNFNYDFLASAKGVDSDSRYLLLEGYFFPDTYEFFVDLNANSVIERFLENFNAKWTDEYAARAQEIGMSVDEVIRLASIIQREAANDEQMAVISSVLHNRLKDSVTYPTLDCDSTYNYITNFVKPVVGDVLANKYMQSYNTYICDKLPAGAICNPGNSAIHAALWPEETDYYYFQHDSNGKIYLAKTNSEHNQYKNKIALESAR